MYGKSGPSPCKPCRSSQHVEGQTAGQHLGDPQGRMSAGGTAARVYVSNQKLPMAFVADQTPEMSPPNRGYPVLEGVNHITTPLPGLKTAWLT